MGLTSWQCTIIIILTSVKPSKWTSNTLVLQECVEWAVQGGADFIVGETYIEFGEAMLALEAIKQYGKGELFNKD